MFMGRIQKWLLSGRFYKHRHDRGSVVGLRTVTRNFAVSELSVEGKKKKKVVFCGEKTKKYFTNFYSN